MDELDNLDRGDNPNEMDAEDWDDFYDNVEKRTGMSFDEYLDNDHSMDY